MRTDASGHGEHASSDSFYDSDNTEAEASPAPKTAATTTKQPTAGKCQLIFLSEKSRSLVEKMSD